MEQWASWLQEHRTALDTLDLPSEQLADLQGRIDDVLPTITSEMFESLHRDVVEFFTPAADPDEHDRPEAADRDDVDSIANLALLSRDDNSVLSNSVFEVKRRHVIGLDRKGSYIPVCTRNVFLKYYDTGVGSKHLHFWGPLDREAYLEAMREVLAPYLLEDIPENEQIEDADEDAA